MSNDVVAAAEQLVDVLERENEALKRVDYAAAAALTPAKEAALAGLAKHQDTLPPPPRIAALAGVLSRLAAENQTLLERAIAVQTRVVRIVAKALTPQPAAGQYGAQCARAPSNRTAALALLTRA